jgi:protein O-GlcNAc transferase
MSDFDDQQTFWKALSLHQAGELHEAAKLYRQITGKNPRNFHALHYLGTIEAALGNYEQAKSYIIRSLSINPTNIQFVQNYATILFQMGDHRSALEISRRGLQLDSADISLLYVSAISLLKLQQFEEAIMQFDKLLSLAPNHIAAINERGSALAELKKYDAALVSFEKVLGSQPQYAEAHLNKGNVLGVLKSFEAALGAYDEALALKPDLADAWVGRGNVLRELKRYDDALGAYDRALALSPHLAGAWLGRGNVFNEIKSYDEAGTALNQALALNPDLAEAWLGFGNQFYELRRTKDASAAFDRALALKPDLAEAWLGRGNVFLELNQYDAAFVAYDKALTLNPDVKYAAGFRLFAKRQMCDWTNLESETARLLSTIRERKPSSVPFALLGISSSAADQLHCATRFIEDQPTFPPFWRGEVYCHDRIRVAYLSADFCDHPVGYLTIGLFEHHDKSRFEITAISFGSEENSTVRRRIEGASEHFIDVRHLSDHDVAELVCRLEIDIVVDLMGLTRGNRLSILARRPAPIQVSYLGYLGSVGANFIDYVIADEIAVPSDQQKYYTEIIVHLPDCFLATDNQLQIASHTPSRLDLGLPAQGFVFCSFNNSYKFGRAVFESWMRLLHAVEGSVLWLLESNPEMVTNLRCEAQRCGIGHDRIIFATRVDLSSHLARQRSADLFLDTTPYNAGATAAAALWSGVPILTMMGETFVGRMAASTLHAVGLPQLVTSSLPDYEALALKIATEPAFCASLKQTLARNRDTFPLFNTERSTRNIEAAYTTMWERYQRGETPRTKWQS